MTESDYKMLGRIVCYAWGIELMIDRFFDNKLQVFRNRPRTPSVTLPKSVCLLYTRKLSECSERVSDELKDEHPEVDWNKICDLRQTIITKEEGFFDPEAAWEVLTVDIPEWKAKCCSILEAYNPDYEQDLIQTYKLSRSPNEKGGG